VERCSSEDPALRVPDGVVDGPSAAHEVACLLA
jgi:hypothetical protein